MAHIVFVSKGDHNEVIGDYSGSPRHAALTAQQWANEFASDPAYEPMRSSYPGAVAAVVDRVSVGKWLPDWSGKYVDAFEKLDLSSDAVADFDDVPVVDADGSSVHTLTLKKKDQDGGDVGSGTESVRLFLSYGVTVSPGTSITLAAGSATVAIGPSSVPCDVSMRAVDPAGNIRPGTLTVRFK